MIALAIVIAALVLIALLRFGVSVEYGEDGVSVKAHAGPLSIRVFPRKEKSEKDKEKAEIRKRKKKEKKDKKKAEEEEKPKEKAPGKLQYFMVILSSAKTALGRLRRRLLIKRLTLHLVAANEDPYKTAMMYGGANAAFNTIVPALEKHFRIRRRDFQATADFCASDMKIYVNAAISIAVWETIYIAAAMLPMITKRPKMPVVKPDKAERKDGRKNGETPD